MTVEPSSASVPCFGFWPATRSSATVSDWIGTISTSKPRSCSSCVAAPVRLPTTSGTFVCSGVSSRYAPTASAASASTTIAIVAIRPQRRRSSSSSTRGRDRHGRLGVAGQRALERLDERVGVRVALVGVLAQRAQHDGVERRRHRGVALRRRDRRLGDLLERDRHRRLGVERQRAGEQLVEHDPDRVEVGARVDRVALRLLGREVLRRAHDRAGLGHVGGAGARDPEVGDLRAPLVVDDHVVGLDVAVHDPAPVREARRLEDLDHQVDRERRVQRAVLAHDLLEVAALEELHRDVVGAVPLRRGRRPGRRSGAAGRRRWRPRGGSARRTRRPRRSGGRAA